MNKSTENLARLIARGIKEQGHIWGIKELAEFLIKNGVIVQPCKVGDKTFLLLEKITGDFEIVESKCVKITENGYDKTYSMYIDCKHIGNTIEFKTSDFDREVFLDRVKAEKVLKERCKK